MSRARQLVVVWLGLVGWIAACTSVESTNNPGDTAVLLAAGDVAECGSRATEATARLLDHLSGTIVGLGDMAYEAGTPEEFSQCYAPTWGRHRDRTRPVPGNHDYVSPGARGYFGYFGALAGPSDKGYYSYDLNGWHVIALNSNCGAVGGCQAGAPQEQWLRGELATHPAPCTIAYWHHSRFSSGPYGANEEVRPFWQALYDAGADVVLSAHTHFYERFAPQTPDGQTDAVRGLRQFTVGTGGADLYHVRVLAANSEDIEPATYGVLRLTLRPASYDWEFLSIDGSTLDVGSAACHHERSAA